MRGGAGGWSGLKGGRVEDSENCSALVKCLRAGDGKYNSHTGCECGTVREGNQLRGVGRFIYVFGSLFVRRFPLVVITERSFSYQGQSQTFSGDTL